MDNLHKNAVETSSDTDQKWGFLKNIVNIDTFFSSGAMADNSEPAAKIRNIPEAKEEMEFKKPTQTPTVDDLGEEGDKDEQPNKTPKR